MKTTSTSYQAALYMRLSKDDTGIKESSSITTQRKMLLSFAKENSFFIYDEYIDDGWSGTNFDRPEFKRMIRDIENKKVNLVITKDLSRLGRDYITVGKYTEIYFPTKEVRYIAINDNYDSNNPYTEIVPFKNIINEMYARDISKKIRSAFTAKMNDGCYIGNFAPYGYQKDPTDKNHLIVNKMVSPIVQKIFSLAAEGKTPIQIARYLNNKNIPTPAMYRCQNHPYLNIDNYSIYKEWTSSTISKMLHNIVYLGHLAQGKTTKASFKNPLIIQNPKEDWIIVKNTHEPIIDQLTYNLISRQTLNNTHHKKGNFINLFSGIAKCKDCGHNMSAVGTRKKGSVANLCCGNYKLHGASKCTNHFIDYNVLYYIVLEAIHEQTKISAQEKTELLTELQKELQQYPQNISAKKGIEELQKRNIELDNIIEKLYKDNFQGIINNDRFQKLLIRYETESQTLNKQITILSDLLKNTDKNLSSPEKSFDQFSNLIESFTNIKVLSSDILYQLIDRIEISQGFFEKTSSGKIKHQAIQIYFRFIGNKTIKKYTI